MVDIAACRSVTALKDEDNGFIHKKKKNPSYGSTMARGSLQYLPPISLAIMVPGVF